MRSHYAFAAAFAAMATIGAAGAASASPTGPGVETPIQGQAPDTSVLLAQWEELLPWFRRDRREYDDRGRRRGRSDDYYDDRRDRRESRQDRYERRRDQRELASERCDQARNRCASLHGGHQGDYEACLSTNNCLR